VARRVLRGKEKEDKCGFIKRTGYGLVLRFFPFVIFFSELCLFPCDRLEKIFYRTGRASKYGPVLSKISFRKICLSHVAAQKKINKRAGLQI
jgi:hypothetical protein